MAKLLKNIIVQNYVGRLTRLDGCVVIDYRGLDSEQTFDLRRSLRELGVRMSVIQNRLAKRALASCGVPEAFLDLLRGPTALLYGEDGAVSASKVITRWHKKNRGAAAVRGGLLRGKVLSPGEVGKLAELPDLATLRGRIAALLLSPAQGLATAANSLVSHFAAAAKARKEALEPQAKES